MSEHFTGNNPSLSSTSPSSPSPISPLQLQLFARLQIGNQLHDIPVANPKEATKLQTKISGLLKSRQAAAEVIEAVDKCLTAICRGESPSDGLSPKLLTNKAGSTGSTALTKRSAPSKKVHQFEDTTSSPTPVNCDNPICSKVNPFIPTARQVQCKAQGLRIFHDIACREEAVYYRKKQARNQVKEEKLEQVEQVEQLQAEAVNIEMSNVEPAHFLGESIESTESTEGTHSLLDEPSQPMLPSVSIIPTPTQPPVQPGIGPGRFRLACGHTKFVEAGERAPKKCGELHCERNLALLNKQSTRSKDSILNSIPDRNI